MRGIGYNIKCGKVFSHLNSLKSYFYFLKKLTTKDTEHKLKPRWIFQVYHVPFTSRTRGVAILFRDNTFLLQSKVIDQNGRFILISGQIS